MAAESTSQAPLKTYRGSCHCGAYIYDVELPEVIEKATECNCSVCSRRGAILAFPVPPKFLKGDSETLTNYTFGRNVFNHKVGYTHGAREDYQLCRLLFVQLLSSLLTVRGYI